MKKFFKVILYVLIIVLVVSCFTLLIKKHKDKEQEVSIANFTIISEKNEYPKNNFDKFKSFIKTGKVQEMIDVGDQIQVKRNNQALKFDVLDFDKMDMLNPNLSHNVILGSHDIVEYGTIPFSVSQLLYYAENGLSAGSYKFTLNKAAYGGGSQYDGVYMFTLTQPVPIKGGFRHTNIGSYKFSYVQNDVIGNYLTTYKPVNSDGTGGEVLETVSVSLYNSSTTCIDLGTFTANDRQYMTDDGCHNSTERNAYGSNRYKDSVIRQWLNSSAESNFWKPQSVFDRIPSCSTMAGFLYGFDEEFVEALGEVEVKTVLHPFDRVGSETFDVTYDKVYLLSREDVYGIDEFSGLSEGAQLEFYQGTGNAEKIKYQNGTARYWWLRTPFSSDVYVVRHVFTDGGLNLNYANGSGGVVPCFCFCG